MTPTRSGASPQPSEPTPDGPEDWLTIPAIDLREPIVVGGQSDIDAGHVVLYAVPGDGLGDAVWPAEHEDDRDRTWLAGHRRTHGAVIADLLDVDDGDRVLVEHDGDTTVFEINGRVLVNRYDYDPAVLQRGDLILQTSETGDDVWLVYADETVPGTPQVPDG